MDINNVELAYSMSQQVDKYKNEIRLLGEMLDEISFCSVELRPLFETRKITVTISPVASRIESELKTIIIKHKLRLEKDVEELKKRIEEL